MTQCIAVLSTMLLALGGTNAHAQRHHLAPGMRVRIWPCGKKAAGSGPACSVVAGAFSARTADMLHLTSAAGTVTAVPVVPAIRVDAFAGRRSHALTGLAAGAVGGFTVGTIYAFTAGCEYGAFGDADHYDDPSLCTLFGAVPMAVGAAAGTLVGLLVRTDRWEPVDSGELSVGVIRAPGGVGLGVSLAFWSGGR